MMVHPLELVLLPQYGCAIEKSQDQSKWCCPPWEVSWLDAWLSPSVFQHAFKQLLVKQPLRRHFQSPGKCHDFEICDLPDPSLDF